VIEVMIVIGLGERAESWHAAAEQLVAPRPQH